MNGYDLLILLFLGIWVVLAVRTLKKKRKGSCCGCSGNCGCCTSNCTSIPKKEEGI